MWMPLLLGLTALQSALVQSTQYTSTSLTRNLHSYSASRTHAVSQEHHHRVLVNGCEPTPRAYTPSPTDVPAYSASLEGTLNGELKKWHKVTLGFKGPMTCETARPNPFSSYALDVTFSHEASGSTMVVPGYYAADGNAANSGASSGDVWLAHFAPSQVGEWTWKADFKTGTNVAQYGGGKSAEYFDGAEGHFEVTATNKVGRDHRGMGMLEYVGEHHLQWAETGEWFLKAGADSPENLLAFEDFDNTPNNGGRLKSWSAHTQDYNEGDPTWAGGRGGSLIGAINYLSEKGMNVFSHLTLSMQGDDENVFPFISDNEDDMMRYDVSKLGQWEVLYEHADHIGMYIHFKTQETENDQLLDGGDLGDERRLYYRELVARFSHHLALNWNIGEENTNTNAQRRDFANYFRELDPYVHHTVVHTYPWEMDKRYTRMLGRDSYSGASLQTEKENVFANTLKWRTLSANSGQKWVITNDEQGYAEDGVVPDADDFEHDIVRKDVLWANIMAGGAGVEYYFGYEYADSDLTAQSFRSRDNMWEQTSYTLEFFKNNKIPFWDMTNENDIVSNDNWCLKQSNDQTLLVYLRNGGSARVELPALPDTMEYEVLWFNPRTGGDLQQGSVTVLAPGAEGSLGDAPSDDGAGKDWAVLLRATYIDGGAIPGEVPEVVSLVLVDAYSNEDIAEIQDGEVFDLVDIGAELSIRAEVGGSPAELITFSLNGKVFESSGAFFLGGDENGDVFAVDELSGAGTFTLDAVATRADGVEGSTFTVAFAFEEPELAMVTGLILVNAETDQDIQVLNDGDVIDLADIGTKLTVRANVVGGVDSIIFDLDGDAGFASESGAPYYLGGNDSGDFLAVPELVNGGEFELSAYAIVGDEASEPFMVKFELTQEMVTKDLVLVDADADKDIKVLEDGDVFNLDEIGTALNLRAVTSGPVESVIFKLNGKSLTVKESTEPYTLGGDNMGDYFETKELSESGYYTIQAIPTSKNKGRGQKGFSKTLSFTLTQPSDTVIAHLTLVDTWLNGDIEVIDSDDVFDLAVVGTSLNIRAEAGQTVESVVFEMDCNGMRETFVDDTAPFSLGDMDGNFIPLTCLSTPGSYIVMATPFSEKKGMGVPGNTIRKAFTIADEGSVVRIEKLTLWDSSAQSKLRNNVSDGYVVDLSVTGSALTVEAVTSGPVQFVVFDYDGHGEFRIEGEAPYAIGGHLGSKFIPMSALSKVGEHKLVVTAYAKNGQPGETKLLRFTVVTDGTDTTEE